MQQNKKSKFYMSRGTIAKILLLLYDVVMVNLAYFLALWLRFDCSLSTVFKSHSAYVNIWLAFVPINTIICLLFFKLFKLYRSVWTFASYREFFNVVYSTFFSFAFHAIGITVLVNLNNSGLNRMPYTYYVFGATIQFLSVLLVRFSYRFILLERSRRKVANDKKSSRVMLVGAGLLSKYTFLTDKKYGQGLTPEQAQEELNRIKAENPLTQNVDVTRLFGGTE